MKKNRLIFLFILILALALWIISASAFALGCLVLLCLPIPLCLVWNKLSVRGMRCTLRADSAAEKGQPIPLKLNVQVGRFSPAAGIRGVITAENMLTGSSEDIPVVLQPNGNRFTARVRYASPYCGQLRFYIKHLLLPDLYAVAGIHIPIQTEPARCTVYPVTFAMDCRDILLPASLQQTDAFTQQGRGNDPTEVFQLREYVPGDPLRGIHWKLSSKTDTLIYRDPSAPVRRALLVYWDRITGTPKQRDTLAESVFSLCQALSEAGYPFSLGYSGTIGCTLEDVPHSEALTDKLPALLRMDEGASADAPDLSSFGRTLWFTARRETIPANENVLSLLCTDSPDSVVVNGVTFTPENYMEILQKLDLRYETYGN